MKVSVLMALHHSDNVQFLDSAIRSVCSDQTIGPNQVVLVKDGPLNEDADAIVSEWKARNNDLITLVELGRSMGLAHALNVGLAHCKYEMVARMDSDDASLPGRLEKQLALFEQNSELDIVGGFAVEVDGNGGRGSVRRVPIAHESIIDSIWACPLIHPTVMYRRDKIIEVGGYNDRLRRRQDYELWFRCASHGLRFGNVDQVLLLYRFDRSTHKKQSVRLALEQGMIGFKGASSIGLSRWKRLACFMPLLRSMLPGVLQHRIYTMMKPIDPRHRRS